MDPIKRMRERLAQRMAERAGNESGTPQSFVPDPTVPEYLNEAQRGSVPEMYSTPSDGLSLDGIGIANVPGASAEMAMELQNRQAIGDDAVDATRAKYIDPEAIDPYAYTEQWTSQFAENFQYGVGQLIGDYGDILQILGSAIGFNSLENGNAISRSLQEWGLDIQNDARIQHIPELENITWGSLLNPQFWAQEGGRFAPQLTEILATMGAAGVAKNLAKKGLQKYYKNELKDVLAAKTKGELDTALKTTRGSGFKVTTPGQSGTSRGITEMAGSGKGFRGFAMTDRGVLTERFGNIIQGVAGGTLMNQRVALANAGEMYNTYNDLNKEFMANNNGQELFTQEELGEMAARTYGITSSYLGADILSWTMTFGGGLDRMKRMGLNPFKKSFSKDAQRKVAGSMFRRATSPVLRGASRFAQKALPEGFEETLQESWEEWAKMKSYQKVHGTLEGFQGLAEKEYSSFGTGGFFDYYTSKDSEAIRVIAGAMGAVAGGMFNVRSMFNKAADESLKLYDRAENLKTIFREGTKGKEMQRMFIQGQLADLIYDGGNAEMFGGFLDHLRKNNIISEEELEQYTDMALDVDRAFQNISDLNITLDQKKALLDNVVVANQFSRNLEEETATAKSRIELLRNTIEDPADLEAAIAREEEILRARTKGLVDMITTAEKNIQNLQTGKKANPIFYDVTTDAFGNEVMINGDPNEGTNEETSIDSKEVRQNVEDGSYNPVSRTENRGLRGKAKELADNLINSIFGKKKSSQSDPETETETGQEEASSPSTESSSQFIDSVDNDLDIIEVDDNIDAMPERIVYRDEDGNELELKLKRNAPRTKDEAVYQYTDSKERSERGDEVIRRKPQAQEEQGTQEEQEQEQSEEETLKFNKEKGVFETHLRELPKEMHTKGKALDYVRNNPFGEDVDTEQEQEKESKKEKAKEKKTSKKKIQENAKKAGVEISEEEAADMEAVFGDRDIQEEQRQEERRKEAERKRLEDEKVDFSDVDPDDDIPFGRERRTNQRRVSEKEKQAHQNMGAVQRPKRKFRLGFPFFGNSRDIRFYNDESTNRISSTLMAIAQMNTVNARLNEMFVGDPTDYKPQVYIVNDLYETYGVDAVGYTIAGAKYIQFDHWNQDDVYMHEMAHIYYQITKNTPQTKNFLSYAMRNKKLVEYVRNTYWDQEQIAVVDENGDVVDIISLGDIDEVVEILNSVDEVTPEVIERIQSRVDEAVQSKENPDGNIKRIPMEEQFVWNEEIFTHTLEGPMSDVYGKLFNPDEKIENVRQRRSKRWWNFLQKKMTDPDPIQQEYNERDILSNMKESELQEYNDMRSAILDSFQSAIDLRVLDENGNRRDFFSIDGRSSRKRRNIIKLNEKRSEINNRINKSINDNFSQRDQPNIDQDEAIPSLIENTYDDRYDPYYESKLNNFDRSINSILKEFSSFYNKYLSTSYISDGGNDFLFMPHFDGDTMRTILMDYARTSDNSIEFIEKIEDSQISEIVDFNRFLNRKMGSTNTRHGKKESFLNSMFWSYNNKSDIQGLHTYVGPNGEVSLEQSRNNREQSKMENQLALVINRSLNRGFAIRSEREGISFNQRLNDEFMAFVSAGNRIKRNMATKADIYTVVNYFSPPGTNVDKIVDENVLMWNGKAYQLDKLIYKLLNSPTGMNVIQKNSGHTPLQTLADYGSMINTGKFDANGNPIRATKSSYRDFIQALVVTNRKWSVDETMLDAARNQNPTRPTDNYLLRMVKRMENIGKEKGLKGFVRFFSGVNVSGVGSESNALLKYWHDRIQKGLPINVNQNMGVRNDMLGTAVNFDESTTEEDRINQTVTFFESLTKNKTSYVIDAGRFSDSARSFLVEAPYIDIRSLGEVKNKKFIFNNNKSAPNYTTIQSAYKIYNQMHKNENLSFADFQNRMNNAIQDQIEFVNDRASIFSKLSTMKGLFTDGKLNSRGQMAIANMEINNTMNGIFFSEVFFPSYGIDTDLDKRTKSATSSTFALQDSVGVETIYFTDPDATSNIYDGDHTDGIAYMLAEEDADGNPIPEYNDIHRIASMGGDIMNLGYALKFGGFGKEMYNDSFKGKNVNDKPSVQPLNAKIVAQQPRLRPLWEQMTNRRKKMIEELSKKGQTLDSNLQSGTENHIIWAVSATANKSHNIPEGTDMESLRLENINSPEATSILDKWYYKDGSFNGLMGSNYGVQTVMDKETHSSVLPVQLFQSIITNADINGNLSELTDILTDITNQMQENFSETRDTILYGSDADIKDLMMNHFSMANMDPKQADLIKDGLSLSIPELRRIAMNTLSNVVKRQSNKLQTPGSIAHSAPSFYEKSYGVTNGSRTLQDYNRRTDGTYSPMEAVVSKNLEKSLRKRSVVTFNKDGSITGDIPGVKLELEPVKNDPLVERERLSPRERFLLESKNAVVKEARKRGVDYHPIFGNVGGQEVQVGWYVEGDKILVSRIPSHGVQTTGVAEVVDFNASRSDAILLPPEFIKRIGGDHDADAIFINHKGIKTHNWNKAFDKIVDHWMSPEMHSEVMQTIEYEAEATKAVNDSDAVYKRFNNRRKLLHYSSGGRATTSENTRGAKSLVGMTANLHTRLGQMRAYNVSFKDPFTINGKRFDKFSNDINKSIGISSAKMMNLVLDNSKYPFAAELNINPHTAGVAMILTNLGLNLSEIGLILNNPVVKEYTKIKANKTVWNNAIQRGDINKLIRNKVRDNYSLDVGNVTSKEISLNTNGDLTSPEAMASILRIVNITSGINQDLLKMNSIMNGHTELDTNAFIISENLKTFKNLLNNVTQETTTSGDTEVVLTLNSNEQLTIPQEFREDPIVRNYIRTAEDYIKMATKIDPTANAVMAKMHNEIVQSNASFMDNTSKRRLQESFEVYSAAIANGFNNLKSIDSEAYMNSLIKKGDPNNIYDRLQSYMQSKTIVDPSDVRKSVPGNRAVLLFSKGLNINTFGDNRFISLNNSFYQNISPELRDRMISEFQQMPLKLQKDLILYDLFMTGWNGSHTMFPLFPKQEVKKLSNKINYYNKSNPGMTISEYNNLIKSIVAKNSSSLMYARMGKGFALPNRVDLRNRKLQESLLKNALENNARIRNMVESGSSGVFFKVTNPGKDDIIVYIPPLDDVQKNTSSSFAKKEDRAKSAISYSVQNALSDPNNFFYADNSDNFIKIISSNSPKNLDGDDGTKVSAPSLSSRTKLNVDNAINKSNQISGRQKKDPYLLKKKLTRQEFDVAMEYDPSVADLTKERLYNEYIEDKKKADFIYKNLVNEKTVKLFSKEELLEMFYSKNNLSDGEMGYGHRNLFAYANVVGAINNELTNRLILEQEKITGRKYDGKDISPIQSWLMANNVPSNHPAVQGMVRQMEHEYKVYLKEKKKYIDQINDATSELYEEQFGLKINSNNILEVLKNVYYSLFKDRSKFYEQLYGPLIVHEVIMNDDGSTVNNMRYKTKEEIDEGVKDGSISKAQKKFYDVTTKMTDHLKQFNLADEQASRSNYIPHTAPALMEAYSRRGMLGLMVNSKTIDERINDVKMNYVNPITGIMEKESFSKIKDVYNLLSRDKKSGSSSALEFLKLKKKAISLARQGKNEDGSPLVLSNIEVGSALGDVFMERFSSSRSNKTADFPSWDLNKAFVDYVNGTLFTNGNEKFGGFKKMLPIVDGVLSQLRQNDNPNMAKYVEKVWKKYFLAGSKQKSGLYNSRTLESLGITTDDTIDYLTKASLFYWLGWKGLAIGNGVYALGNVLVGKYKNVVNNGGKAWSLGEKRFWGVDDGFDISKFGPRKANEILKRTGFMDINLYDDVNVQTKNSFEKNMASLALMPMTYSERWIQGVQFLGLLTDEEWQNLKNGGELDFNRLNQLEEEVKKSQGKGYQATDQRMVQMYSWGRNMLQFSRFIPTMAYELLSPRDVNRYGKEHIGTYRMYYEAIQRAALGNWSPKELVNYRKGLSDTERIRFDSALIGFGILTGAATVGSNSANDLFWDANAVFDTDKLAYKTTPPSVSMMENLIF